MLMSDFEIVRDFKSAAKKGKQIGILADMNGCSREKIREVLLRNGISEAELPGKPGRKATEEEKEIFRPAKTTKQKPGGEVPRVVGGTPAPQTKKPTLSAESEKGTPAAVPEAVHVVPETRQEVPETVKQLCRDRIWSIIQRVKELHQTIEEIEKEKKELQEFLGASE